MGCYAAGGACDVIQYGCHFGCHLGFYRKLEIVKERSKLKFFILDIKNMT